MLPVYSNDSSQGASLSMKKKPEILKDYFKWHHNPSKGDSVVLPDFSEEMSIWWSSIQPEWRYKNEYPPDDTKDYSYILAGGKKGIYLFILCHWGQGPIYPVGTCWVHWEYRQCVTTMCPLGPI